MIQNAISRHGQLWQNAARASKFFTIFLALLFHCGICRAQAPALDLTFNPGTGVSSPSEDVYSIFVETNGQIIVGGYFSQFNGIGCNAIVRLNRDGSADTNFFVGQGPNTGDWVSAVAVQTNGMILVGGNFYAFNGVNQANLVRLRVDGSLDISFKPVVTGQVSIVQSLANGQFLIAGYFSQVNGQSSPALARLNIDGSLDSNFFTGITSGNVTSLATDSGGNILVAGQFKFGTNQYSVARLTPDGSFDPTFAPGPMNGAVAQIGVSPNGEIIVTGSFSEINGYSRTGIAELYSDGTVDANFRPIPSNGYGSLLAIEADGKIFATGNGYQTSLIRINTDGSVDISFNPKTSNVRSLAIQPDGRLLIGGQFSQVNGTNINGIARLQGDSLTPFQTQLLNLNFYPGMEISGSVGTVYRIESSTNLAAPSLWTPLTTFTLTNTPCLFIDTNAVVPNVNRFYRSVVIP